jgi:hypothetical protein
MNYFKRIYNKLFPKPIIIESIKEKYTEQEFCDKVSKLLKTCKEWYQVYRLYELTKKRLGWEEGGKAVGLTQVVLNLQFSVLQLQAQLGIELNINKKA